ncbi:MAG: hypothetical protein AB1589_37010 [Cyanobacteriota bacterium]
MNVLQTVKWTASSLVFVTLMSSSATATGMPRFFVECHAADTAQNDTSQQYWYHLRAHGFAERVENGININLDEKKMVLSVDIKQPGQEGSTPLYTDLPLVQRKEQPCENEQCQKVDYEPKDFQQSLIVTYDKDKGGISVKHAIAPDKVVESRGGCMLVGLPSGD